MAYGSEQLKSLYYRMPIAVKNSIATAYGVRQRSDRYGKYFESHKGFLENSQNWNNERLVAFNDEQTIDFVNRAIRECEYYANRKDYHPITSIEELATLPVLTKEEVRKHITEFYSGTVSKQAFRWVHTSGTTGKSLVFPVSKSAFQREYAFRAVHYSWGNVYPHLRHRVAYCAGHPIAAPDRKIPPFWAFDYANNWLLLSSYHMSERNLNAYIRKLEKYNPEMIGGYPSSLYLLALANKKYGSEGIRVKAVYCASETLFDHQKLTIEDSFGCKAFNWYGNTELCGNIVECERGELHLKYEHSKIELLNENDDLCKPGDTGRLVCTGFGNLAFPLIRYEVGDVATISQDQTTRCGRGGLIIDRVEGRKEDYIVTGDGRLVGRLDHLFKDSINVIEGQIRQNRVGEVVLNIVKSDKYSKDDEDLLLREAKLRLGAETEVNISYVNSIPRTPNGKFPFIVSSVNQYEVINNLASAHKSSHTKTGM